MSKIGIITFFRAMPLRKKIILLTTLILAIVSIVLFFVFEKQIMSGNNNKINYGNTDIAKNYLYPISPIAEEVRDLNFGYLVIGGLIIASSIPPLPGYGTMTFICGFIYGFPLGFALAYTSAFLGAAFSFYLCRSICLGYARKLTKRQSNFQRLTLAIEEGGFKIILLIRLSPFPFPWSNAFFGTIQTVSFWKFMLATALSLLKLAIHVFIGSKFGSLSEDMDPTSSIINYVSLAISFILLLFAAWYIYNKMNSMVDKAAAKREMEESVVDLSVIGSSEFLVGDVDDGEVVDETADRRKHC